jgi:hypothetical protein
MRFDQGLRPNPKKNIVYGSRVDYKLINFRVDSNTFTMGLGNPMPELTLTLDAWVNCIPQSGTSNFASEHVTCRQTGASQIKMIVFSQRHYWCPPVIPIPLVYDQEWPSITPNSVNLRVILSLAAWAEGKNLPGGKRTDPIHFGAHLWSYPLVYQRLYSADL